MRDLINDLNQLERLRCEVCCKPTTGPIGDPIAPTPGKLYRQISAKTLQFSLVDCPFCNGTGFDGYRISEKQLAKVVELLVGHTDNGKSKNIEER
jgi:hypothetical protein